MQLCTEGEEKEAAAKEEEEEEEENFDTKPPPPQSPRLLLSLQMGRGSEVNSWWRAGFHLRLRSPSAARHAWHSSWLRGAARQVREG